MIRPLYGFNREIAAFVGFHIPNCGTDFGNCKAIGFLDNNNLVAGVVYHNWDPDAKTIEISCAAITRRWTTKETVRRIFEYPFDQIGCQMVVARIAESNATARRIWRALGATEHVIPRLTGRNEAQIIATLTDDVWRSGKFGRMKNG